MANNTNIDETVSTSKPIRLRTPNEMSLDSKDVKIYQLENRIEELKSSIQQSQSSGISKAMHDKTKEMSSDSESEFDSERNTIK